MEELKNLRMEFNELKDKQDNQEELNQRIMDRFDYIDDRVKALEDAKPVMVVDVIY